MLEFDAVSREMAARIAQAAQDAYAMLLRRVRAGEDVRKVLLDVQLGFTGDFATLTAQAFTQLLRREVTPDHIPAVKVGEVTLSRRLHALDQEVISSVSAVIRTHAQGLQDARALGAACTTATTRKTASAGRSKA